MSPKKKAKKATKKTKKVPASKKTKKKKRLAKVAEPEILSPKLGSESSTPSTALSATDPTSQYLAEIRKYPLLDREEEHRLAVQYFETGNASAAERLVTSNLRFVVKVAAEYTKFGAKLIDLIQEGNVGLMHAVKEFNPYKGVRLITYAVWWVRGHIQEHLMRQYSMVRIGTTSAQRKLFYQLQKQRDELIRMGHEPSVKLLSGRLGVTEKDVELMTQRMSGSDISLDQPIDGQDGSTLIELQAGDYGEPLDEQLGHAEELSQLTENIDEIRPQLNPREIELLDERLLSDSPLTLQEIADRYSVSREAVRQMEVRVLNKIRKQMLPDAD